MALYLYFANLLHFLIERACHQLDFLPSCGGHYMVILPFAFTQIFDQHKQLEQCKLHERKDLQGAEQL